MADAKRDVNQVVVMMGVDPDGNVAPVKIDSVTGYVLLQATGATSTVPVAIPGYALHDVNGVRTMTAVNPSAGISSILFDHNNTGKLWVTTS